jgi:Raf kinase inhibitor-like YbhB/YbcL family protein
MGTFDHWIAWNIPADTKSFAEGFHPPKQGINGFGQTRYRGPCPPPGRPHRYFFKLYALDTLLDLPDGSDKAALEEAMEGHILANAELIGLYQR